MTREYEALAAEVERLRCMHNEACDERDALAAKLEAVREWEGIIKIDSDEVEWIRKSDLNRILGDTP